MTVQPTHQDANGRKFVKVGELVVPLPNYAPEIWQEVNTGEVVHRYPGGKRLPYNTCSCDGDLTPIPQPEVRWIAVRNPPTDKAVGFASDCYLSRSDAILNCRTADYVIRIETLNGVRTASVEEA